MRVLVAEDDLTLQRGLMQVLQTAGHQVDAASDGAHADRLLASEGFDLVILDLGLPEMSGLQVLERLRKRRVVIPVLILSARAQMSDRVLGLDAGADDYLTKPFELAEFEARVRSLLRRGQGSTQRIGHLDWSWEARQGRVDAQELPLSKQEVTILELLLVSPGKIVPKETLARRLGDGAIDGDNLVEVYIHRLRRKLKDAGVEIRTIRGLGYLLSEAGASPTT